MPIFKNVSPPELNIFAQFFGNSGFPFGGFNVQGGGNRNKQENGYSGNFEY